MKKIFSPINQIGLAPMAGPGDSAFRRICREWGADYTVTEMISAKALQFGADKTVALADHHPSEEPLLIQLFGRDPDAMEYAASFIEDRFHPIGIDLNMGCPAPKIFNNGDGSALLREPDLAAKLVEAAQRGCSCPVSVKMRIGITEPDNSVIDFAQLMEYAGASFITVHGRTREQFYAGQANYAMIRCIKENVKIPVIANGDVIDGASAKRILSETGADGIMLARGALGSPYVFRCIKDELQGVPFNEISLKERFDIALRQLKYAIEDKGEQRACVEFRKHLLWYLKGINGASVFKVAAGQVSSMEDCANLLDEVLLNQK
ncbi:MAG: tRNA dihydrouridine synthase DusB [Clostridia bacterium]|nr:tRNA dihydrouridine synthase DusB [Clostridia bacterium]